MLLLLTITILPIVVVLVVAIAIVTVVVPLPPLPPQLDGRPRRFEQYRAAVRAADHKARAAYADGQPEGRHAAQKVGRQRAQGQGDGTQEDATDAVGGGVVKAEGAGRRQ